MLRWVTNGMRSGLIFFLTSPHKLGLALPSTPQAFLTHPSVKHPLWPEPQRSLPSRSFRSSRAVSKVILKQFPLPLKSFWYLCICVHWVFTFLVHWDLGGKVSLYLKARTPNFFHDNTQVGLGMCLERRGKVKMLLWLDKLLY